MSFICQIKSFFRQADPGTLNKHDGTFVGDERDHRHAGLPQQPRLRGHRPRSGPRPRPRRPALHRRHRHAATSRKTGKIWTYQGLDRTLSTVSVADGLVYVSDVGRPAALPRRRDRQTATGSTTPRCEVWGSTLVADGKVYMPTSKGLWVLAAGKELKVLSRINLGAKVYASPVAANGTLYVATTAGWLWAVRFVKRVLEPARRQVRRIILATVREKGELALAQTSRISTNVAATVPVPLLPDGIRRTAMRYAMLLAIVVAFAADAVPQRALAEDAARGTPVTLDQLRSQRYQLVRSAAAGDLQQRRLRLPLLSQGQAADGQEFPRHTTSPAARSMRSPIARSARASASLPIARRPARCSRGRLPDAGIDREHERRPGVDRPGGRLPASHGRFRPQASHGMVDADERHARRGVPARQAVLPVSAAEGRSIRSGWWASRSSARPTAGGAVGRLRPARDPRPGLPLHRSVPATTSTAWSWTSPPVLLQERGVRRQAGQAERGDMMTDFASRRMTEEAGLARGRPILVAMRVPDSVDYCRDMGFDLPRWLEEGLVDLLVTTCYFQLNPWSTGRGTSTGCRCIRA